ncbi:MAG TPA: radical SAM protein [Myxococcota bacterium]|nr:radical SAM protein [Myxococcota bacterium]
MVCNERCPFCNVPAEDFSARPMPIADIRAQIQDFVATGQQTLTISGGEPTLLKRLLLQSIAEARVAGLPFVELQTNAVLIDGDYAAALKEAGLTSAFVSLLSDVPVLHDQLAGLPGAFPRCVAGIEALLDQGIAVTLNPVTAAVTAARVPDYVDFVAGRLSGVQTISLSAVQPHGRAAKNLDLLPDYAVLGPAIREARRRAAQHGLTLLNPYCGLPRCVGWEDGEHCAEAAEAAEQDYQAPNVENVQANKLQGPPCRDCGLRTRCGGAWRAYWERWGASGLRAPLPRRTPWEGGEAIRAFARNFPEGWATDPRPGLFLWLDRLAAEDLEAVQRATLRDLAVEGWDRETLRGLRRLLATPSPLPQRQLRVAWLLSPDAGLLERIGLLSVIGVDTVFLQGTDGRLAALAARLREQFPSMTIKHA